MTTTTRPTLLDLTDDSDTVVSVIGRVAASGPDRVAVRCGAEHRTYGELWARSDTVANYLSQELGIGQGDVIGVCVGRHIDLPAVLLGVLRTGAAYLPLDPLYPADRLDAILRDVDPAAVVSTSSLAWHLPAGPPVVLLEHIDRTDGAPALNQPGDLAYVIFTSGSTGTPKGVMVDHSSLANTVNSFAALLKAGAHDVLLSVTSLLFDIAALELFLPLSVGAELVICHDDAGQAPEAVLSELRATRPTIMQATPTLWRMLMLLAPFTAPTLTVLCGGEPLSADLASELRTRCQRVFNVYGPTETTIWSTAHELGSDEPFVSIGSPIDNTLLRVCDPSINDVADGVVGELLIGGAGVARGYWNRPDLTAERFIEADGARWYRTGDRVRRDTVTGLLECLGRDDSQIKLRGFRIELGEIETALRADPSVTEAAVVVHGVGDAATLVAYVTANGGTIDTEALLRSLGKRLPQYMVPGRLHEVAQMPLTPGGKLDRASLPVAPAGAPRDAGRDLGAAGAM